MIIFNNIAHLNLLCNSCMYVLAVSFPVSGSLVFSLFMSNEFTDPPLIDITYSNHSRQLDSVLIISNMASYLDFMAPTAASCSVTVSSAIVCTLETCWWPWGQRTMYDPISRINTTASSIISCLSLSYRKGNCGLSSRVRNQSKDNYSFALSSNSENALSASSHELLANSSHDLPHWPFRIWNSAAYRSLSI